jgi:hypothetical protein
MKRFAASVLLVLAGFVAGLAWPYLQAPKPNQSLPTANLTRLPDTPAPPTPPRREADAPSKPRSTSDKMIDEWMALAKTDIAAAFRKISGITPESYQSRLR